jgi:hypothetical protein
MNDKLGYYIARNEEWTLIPDHISHYIENDDLGESLSYYEYEGFVKIRYSSFDDLLQYVKNNLNEKYYYSKNLSDEDKKKLLMIFETYGDLL